MPAFKTPSLRGFYISIYMVLGLLFSHERTSDLWLVQNSPSHPCTCCCGKLWWAGQGRCSEEMKCLGKCLHLGQSCHAGAQRDVTALLGYSGQCHHKSPGQEQTSGLRLKVPLSSREDAELQGKNVFVGKHHQITRGNETAASTWSFWRFARYHKSVWIQIH